MKNNTRIGLAVLVVVILIAAVVFAVMRMPAPQAGQTPPTGTGSQPTATVAYSCDADQTITAAYYQGASTPAASPDQPPTPGGSVALTLSDGRTMTLPQTISADGTRYANADGSFVFWSKGNGAMVLENNQQKSFVGCIMVAPQPAGADLSQVYSSGSAGFSLRLPDGYTPDSTYTYQELGPGKDIAGVKFTIPASLAKGTNLGSDSYISVEQIPATTDCSALLFLDSGAIAKTVTDNGTTYSMATSNGAGAGNRYDETVYAIPGTNPCMAVRYFIHYSVFENYPAGTVTQFNESALVATFDQIRQTLVVNQ